MLDAEALVSRLRQDVDVDVAAKIERFIREAPDADLNRVNPMAFAAEYGLEESVSIAGFLHAARIGLFDLSWNVVCGGCGGVLHSGESLKAIDRSHYNCALCAADCASSLEDSVEVTFTVDRRVREIAGHHPEMLPLWDYARQIYWSSGSDLPGDSGPIVSDAVVDAVDLAAAGHATRSLTLLKGMMVVFDPVTHSSQFLEVAGVPVNEPRELTITIEERRQTNATLTLAPGPLTLLLQNNTDRRVLPILWIAGEALLALVSRRIPVLTAKRLLTHQTFRDIHRTDVLNIDQQFMITNMTFMFTDLKGSTELYERVGDLAAFDLVRAHFQALTEIVSEESGAVVKTIGDAVMATFPTPVQGIAAALRMRDAMKALNDRYGREDIFIKIGLHAGSCLVVLLNERQDYFGQTVNIASRVQGHAGANAILVTRSIVDEADVDALLGERGFTPRRVGSTLRGIDQEVSFYEIA